MTIDTITSLDDPRVADFRNVPDPVLLRDRGLFVAEGRLIVRHVLDARRFRVRSLLLSPAGAEGLRDVLAAHAATGTGLEAVAGVFVAPAELLSAIVGFDVHRGCLALCERPAPVPVDAVMAGAAAANLLLVAERVGNADNMGGLFRNAMAFGAGAVLLSPGCCDPFYRKAVRVSSGGTLRVPFATFADWPSGLSALAREGWALVGLTPDAAAASLEEWASRADRPARTALVVGHEGSGLSEAALAMMGARVRIAMAGGVDSLNVATAAAIAMYVCSNRGPRA